ncbi:hypothetical protein [Sphingosinithalassobacter portus]|uniref:hypothetical protein n=1 Tax=Stakelama portus TaxID=2676234 RepID=UPI0011AB7A71|nr:hypothetical protein [Sphingosinithalassobacter portus]
MGRLRICRTLRLTVALSPLLLLPACVAVAVPIAAGGLMARNVASDSQPRSEAPPVAAAPTAQAPQTDQRVEMTSLRSLPPPEPADRAASTQNMARVAAGAGEEPEGNWELLGEGELPAPAGAASGAAGDTASPEGAARSIQAFQTLYGWLAERAASRAGNFSVVLAEGATASAPAFMPCEGLPPGMIVAIDGKAIAATGGAQRLVAAPGAVETLDSARRVGIALFYLADLPEADVPALRSALERVGIDPGERGKTLWLTADGATPDAVRRRISSNHCIVALAGDRLPDFSGLFAAQSGATAQRNSAAASMLAPMWGRGWFLVPSILMPAGAEVDLMSPPDGGAPQAEE